MRPIEPNIHQYLFLIEFLESMWEQNSKMLFKNNHGSFNNFPNDSLFLIFHHDCQKINQKQMLFDLVSTFCFWQCIYLCFLELVDFRFSPTVLEYFIFEMILQRLFLFIYKNVDNLGRCKRGYDPQGVEVDKKGYRKGSEPKLSGTGVAKLLRTFPFLSTSQL